MKTDLPSGWLMTLNLESSMKTRSFLNQRISALGSAATRQVRVKGSPKYDLMIDLY